MGGKNKKKGGGKKKGGAQKNKKPSTSEQPNPVADPVPQPAMETSDEHVPEAESSENVDMSNSQPIVPPPTQKPLPEVIVTTKEAPAPKETTPLRSDRSPSPASSPAVQASPVAIPQSPSEIAKSKNKTYIDVASPLKEELLDTPKAVEGGDMGTASQQVEPKKFPAWKRFLCCM